MISCRADFFQRVKSKPAGEISLNFYHDQSKKWFLDIYQEGLHPYFSDELKTKLSTFGFTVRTSNKAYDIDADNFEGCYAPLKWDPMLSNVQNAAEDFTNIAFEFGYGVKVIRQTELKEDEMDPDKIVQDSDIEDSWAGGGGSDFSKLLFLFEIRPKQ